MYRVVLVDDEQIILDGLSRAVRWADMGCAVAEGRMTPEECWREVTALSPFGD